MRDLHQYRDCRLLGWEPHQGQAALDKVFRDATRKPLEQLQELHAAYERQCGGFISVVDLKGVSND